MAAASSQHRRDGCLTAKEHALQVHVQDLVPQLLRGVHDGGQALDACVVEEHVDAPERLLGGADQGCRALAPRDVRDHGHDLAGLGHLVHGGGPVARDDASPFGREDGYGGSPDPGRRPRDYRDLTRQESAHRFLLWCRHLTQSIGTPRATPGARPSIERHRLPPLPAARAGSCAQNRRPSSPPDSPLRRPAGCPRRRHNGRGGRRGSSPRAGTDPAPACRATSCALKMRPSNRGSNPVVVSASRIRSCVPLEATHVGVASCASTSATPGTAVSDVRKASNRRSW